MIKAFKHPIILAAIVVAIGVGIGAAKKSLTSPGDTSHAEPTQVQAAPAPALVHFVAAEPAPADRKLWLSYLHPNAASNPVKKIRIDTMTIGQLKAQLERDRLIWDTAALDCVGGYNPMLPKEMTQAGTDFLAFDLATTSTSAGKTMNQILADAPDDASVHDICMIKARSLAQRNSTM